MSKIIYKNQEEYTAASTDHTISAGKGTFDMDVTGQIIVYTGVYAWADGSYRDQPENPAFREEEEEEPSPEGTRFPKTGIFSE